MGLCANDSKRKRPFKTIIIPKGVINPNENNIIEIPMDLDTSTNLIVKAPTDMNSCFSVEPYRGDLAFIPPGSKKSLQIVHPAKTSYSYINRSSEELPPTCSQVQPSSSNYPTTHYQRPAQVNISSQTCPSFLPNAQSSTYQNQQANINATCPAFLPRAQIQQPTQANINATCPAFLSRAQSSTYQIERPIQTDISAQTCPAFLSKPSSSSCLSEAHSPLCPICSRASCRFFPNTGVNPFSTRFGQFSYPPYSTPHTNIGPPFSSYKPTDCMNPLKSNKSKELENEALSQMLDDKINKILKPILMSLAKFDSNDDDDDDDGDEEKYLGTCPAMTSWSSFKPEKKYEPEDDDLCSRKCADRRSSRSSISDTDSISKKYDRERDCVPNTSCQKRTSVSFDKDRNTKIERKPSKSDKADEKRPERKNNKSVDLNKGFLE